MEQWTLNLEWESVIIIITLLVVVIFYFTKFRLEVFVNPLPLLTNLAVSDLFYSDLVALSMAIPGFLLLLLFLSCSPPALSLYEDQVGLMDWLVSLSLYRITFLVVHSVPFDYCSTDHRQPINTPFVSNRLLFVITGTNST